MAKQDLQNIVKRIPEISTKRGYWFFRTQGGEFYDAFVAQGYVSMGYDKISLFDISKGNTGDRVGLSILSDHVAAIFPDEKRPGFIASQLLRFAYGMKKGDVIMIPSAHSHKITFGVVEETAAYSERNRGKDGEGYLKRKKVRWIKTQSRFDLDPNLYGLIYTHQAIADASGYEIYIDKELNSLYHKGNVTSLVLDVEKHGSIKARDLFELGNVSLQLLDEYCLEEGLPFDSSEIDIKITVQSPGDILLSGTNVTAIVLFGIILIAIAGGGMGFKSKQSATELGQETDAHIKTDGIIEKMRRFLNSKSNRATKKTLVEKHLKDLKIENPKDLIEILKELNK